MHHRGHVELDHGFVHRIPIAVGQRRRGPLAATRVGVEVEPDEAHVHGTTQLGDRGVERVAGELRQLTDTDERVGVEVDDACDEVVACAGPRDADLEIALVVGHRGGARREDRHVGAALAEQLELVLLDRVLDLGIGDDRVRRSRPTCEERVELAHAPLVVGRRRGRVVTVTVDDHAGVSSLASSASSVSSESSLSSAASTASTASIMPRVEPAAIASGNCEAQR